MAKQPKSTQKFNEINGPKSEFLLSPTELTGFRDDLDAKLPGEYQYRKAGVQPDIYRNKIKDLEHENFVFFFRDEISLITARRCFEKLKDQKSERR